MKWLDKWKGGKKEQILILLLAGILLLVIALPTGQEEQGTTPVKTETAKEPVIETESRTQAEILEEKLQRLLGQVAGIGKTEVMITLKSDGHQMVEKDLERQEVREDAAGAEDVVESQVSSSESTVYRKDAQGNELPYVTETLAPEVSGVLVIAEGGGNASVVTEITEAVMALFGVEAHKIKVMKME